MALVADVPAQAVTDQHVVVSRSVGVVTARAGESPSVTARVLGGLHRVSLYRVSSSQILEMYVASATQVIYGFSELIAVFRGMRTVTCQTSISLNDSVYALSASALYQPTFFVRMTVHTQCSLAVCPQLERISASVGVVTHRAVTRAYGAVNMGLAFPFSSVDVTAVTDDIHFPYRDDDMVCIQ